MAKESLYPEDWVKIAEEDLERVGKRIQEGDLKDAAFHLQQAIEKYLKAFLLSKGWKLKKIHDLRALLEEAIKYAPELSEFNTLCQEVTAYYMLERYPFFEEVPEKDELKSITSKAKKLIKILKIKK